MDRERCFRSFNQGYRDQLRGRAYYDNRPRAPQIEETLIADLRDAVINYDIQLMRDPADPMRRPLMLYWTGAKLSIQRQIARIQEAAHA